MTNANGKSGMTPTESETTRTPQGAVISPLYANLFLRYVLDLWINDWRQRHATGEVSGKTRRGDFTIQRKTSRKKFQAKLTALKEQLFRKRHDDLATVGAWLQSVFGG
jgi:retron-type reverse transcriptase